MRPAPSRAPDPVARRLKGQHFTDARVADLVNAFCLRSADDVVLDPACGDGAFLLRARERLRWLGGGGALHGVELDAGLAAAARERLPEATIVTADFLDPADPAGGLLCDAVVGNPPYVRQERLGPQLKRRLHAMAPGGVSRRADLHVYFWRRAMSLLQPGGRLGFVTSASWLDALYGEGLRRWIASTCRLVALIESAAESWFADARVRTVVAILEKAGPAGVPPARFVRLSRRLDRIAPQGIDEDERLERFEDLARGIEAGRPGAAPGTRVRLADDRALEAPRWGPLLRPLDPWPEIHERAAGRFVPLEEVAEVRWGIKTGDDMFFFVARDAASTIEPRFLVPAVFNLMELDRVVVDAGQLKRRLLLVDLRDGPIAGLEVARCIRRAQRERGSHRRPTCAARERDGAAPRRWFELRPGPPGAILWSIMHQYRHLAPLNPEGFPANDNLLLVRPRPGVRARLLAALLNSHLQALIKQAYGRRRNEGMLKTQAIDVKQMPVPDPRRIEAAHAARVTAAFEAIARRPIGRLPEECRRADRRELDAAAMRALGFGWRESLDLVRRVRATLTSLCRDERAWEIDALSRRAGTRLRPAAPRSASAPAAPGPGCPR